MKENYHIYILQSDLDGRYYVGYSKDYRKRVYYHNNGFRKTYTSKYRPWRLVGLFRVVGGRSEAMSAEKYIKRQKSRRFIEDLISGKIELKGDLAQLVSVPTGRD